jgi:NodT family efflux transporter outer membrane factor (OMF) lipoprotein
MLQFKSYALIALINCVLAGCAVGPNFHPPQSPHPCHYTALPMPSETVSTTGKGGQSQHFAFYDDIPGQWWTLFHSPDLNELVCQAISNSPNLAAAQAALRQAQQNLRAEIGLGYFPQVTGTLYVEREKFPGTSIGIAQDSTVFTLYNASVAATYTLDVFGGIRRLVEEFRAQVDYEYFELEATYLTLTANVVTTAINEALLNAQIETTHELIAIEQNQLDILKKQLQLGGVALGNILQQQAQLAQLQATLPPLEKSLSQARHALAVLVGVLPNEGICLPDFNLDSMHLPTELPVSCPTSLVRQRPDVRASEALWHAASAQIGVATANLLPQFPLTATYGSQANTLGTLFQSDTIFWSYMAELTQQIFNGGALVAQRRAAIAAFDQAAAQYRQTVLVAFQNVADSLKALEYDALTLKANTKAEAAALGSLNLIQKQYKVGGVSFLNVLIAQQQYQQARLNRVQSQAARYADTAALFQSLGGGWWNRDFCIAPAPQKMDLIDWL